MCVFHTMGTLASIFIFELPASQLSSALSGLSALGSGIFSVCLDFGLDLATALTVKFLNGFKLL